MAVKLPSFLLVLGLVGCTIDVDVTGAGTEELSACNAVAGTGCTSGEKCTWLTLGERTDCAPAGTAGEGMPCTFGETTGVDDCRAGLYCTGGLCTRICGIRDNTHCIDGEECRAIDAFHDHDATGVCVDTAGLMKPWWP